MFRERLRRLFQDFKDDIHSGLQAAQCEHAQLEPDDPDFAEKAAAIKRREVRLGALARNAPDELPEGEVCPRCVITENKNIALKTAPTSPEGQEFLRCPECELMIDIP